MSRTENIYLLQSKREKSNSPENARAHGRLIADSEHQEQDLGMTFRILYRRNLKKKRKANRI